jgi:hypothetical protein
MECGRCRATADAGASLNGGWAEKIEAAGGGWMDGGWWMVDFVRGTLSRRTGQDRTGQG